MINTLTSLRFFAALAVFLSHLFILQNFEETKWIFDRIFFEGYLGVTFFFILSGFILTYNYHNKFQKYTKGNLKNFMVARFARIYPVYILTFLISLIPFFVDDMEINYLNQILTGIANLGMIQSFVPIPSVYFSFNAPSWSISDEMFFYLIFPFVILTLIKFKKNKFLTFFIPFTFLIYISACLVVWYMRDSQLAHWLFYIFPPFRFIDFFIGIIIGLVFVKMKEVKISNRIFSIFEIVSILLLIIAIYFFPTIHQTLRLWGYYLLPLVFIIWVFAFQKGVISQFLSHKVFVYLGEISFSFYMIHKIVMGYMEITPFVKDNPYIFVLTTFLITLILSHIIYKYYEIPLKNKIRHKLS
ncbi:acyltransferase family protein [Lysinibacillus sphaericus]|uniref:acyltransferase family protein n=1 Tax=Lysinibacillus sphaericus TaxID=1421 RepID=UPI003CFC45B9